MIRTHFSLKRPDRSRSPRNPRKLAYRAAITRIQRAFRGYLAIKNTNDPITLDIIDRSCDVLLVEPNGAAFRFDAKTLAAHMLIRPHFKHPITGRELLDPELTRIGTRAGLSPRLLPVLRSFEKPIKNHQAMKTSLATFMENEMHNFFQSAMALSTVYAQELCKTDIKPEILDRIDDEMDTILDNYLENAMRLAKCDLEAYELALTRDKETFRLLVGNNSDLTSTERQISTTLDDGVRLMHHVPSHLKPKKTASAGWLRDLWKSRP